MNLTAEQAAAVADHGNRVVSSCPGSGKTRTIIAKILRCIEEIADTPRKICCITYTNAATNEISARLLQFGNGEDALRYEVNTIHSFCLNNIVRPYGHLLPELAKGFEVLPPDAPWYIETVKSICQKYRVPPNYAEFFANITFKLTGELVVPNGIKVEAAAHFIRLIRDKNYITFGDIVYFAFRIANENNYVARALSTRFAWMLVDEFQDTSELQVGLLLCVHRVGKTKFFLVGDPNQSIFSFAGARPDLMASIPAQMSAASDLSLTQNYRCSTNIIRVAERLCPRTPPMAAFGQSRDCPFVPSYINASSIDEAILGYFLPELARQGIAYGSCAVLAPWWMNLVPLARKLRERAIPVIGPGARPYKCSSDFAQFAEAAAAYTLQPDSESATAAHRALFYIILQITSRPNWRIYSYEGKKTLCRLLNSAALRYEARPGALHWLADFASSCCKILLEDELMSSTGAARIHASAAEMVASIRKFSDDADNMTIDGLGIFAKPKSCVQLLTLHASKGHEYDAVAVVDFHDDKVSHYNADANGVEEARRLTYVAATRARKLLMFFCNTSDRRNRPSRFVRADGMQL